jgi:aryl-alcohol dehydrogenase-like predicted oxidoreductase
MNGDTKQVAVDRREFLKSAMAALAASGFGREALSMQRENASGIPTRPLGRSDEQVPIVGLGGYHIGLPDQTEALRIMHEAIDEGMTFFDNAWDYHRGRSEEVMGKALADNGRRKKVFLMTKCCARDYAGAKQHLEDSLRRLKTGYLDLWQFHEINWSIDAEWLFEKGAVKAAVEARKAGKVRYIGFTGHRATAHHLKTIGQPFEWDTVQMPINLLDAHYDSFQEKVVPVCRAKKIAVIGMKALAGGMLPRKVGVEAEACRRFALSLPITSLVCGIQSRENLRQDLAMARQFKPIDAAEMATLIADTKTPGSDGKLELWKTTDYGGLYHREQHKGIPRGEEARETSDDAQ